MLAVSSPRAILKVFNDNTKAYEVLQNETVNVHDWKIHLELSRGASAAKLQVVQVVYFLFSEANTSLGTSMDILELC